MELTKTELGIWRGQKMFPGIPLYNTGILFEIRGKIHPDHFLGAFKKTVESIPLLRSVIEERDGLPIRTIRPAVDQPIEFIDWSGTSTSPQGVRDFFEERNRRFLDPEERCLDSVLLQLNDGHFFWFLNQHHIITDAVSTQLVYEAQMISYQGKEIPSAWQAMPPAKLPSQETKDPQWSRAGTPGFFDKQPSGSTGSSRISVELGVELSRQITDFAKRHLMMWSEDTAKHNFFLMVTATFLHLMTGRKKVSLGTTISNRDSAQARNRIGMLMELVSMSSQLENPTKLSEITNSSGIDLFDFWKQVGGGTANKNPRSFSCLVNYLGVEYEPFDGNPTYVSWFHSGHHDPYLDCRFQIHDFDAQGSLTIDFDWKDETFDATDKELAVGAYRALLDAFLAEDDKDLATLSASLFQSAKGPNRKTYVDVWEQIEHQTEIGRDRVAVASNDLQVTYGELDSRASQLAHWIAETQPEVESVVLHLSRSVDYVVALLSALKLAKPFVPLPVNAPSKRKQAILQALPNPLVICRQETSGQFGNAPTLAYDSLKTAPYPRAFEARPLTRGALAYILFTSGSTGRPKGVGVSRASLSAYLSEARSMYAQGRGLSFPLFSSIGFDLTLTSTLLPLTTGGRVVAYPESDESTPDLVVTEAIRDQNINAIKLTPSHLRLLREEDFGASQVDTLIVGGEDLPVTLAAKVTEQMGTHVALYNEYGPTEATIGCIVHRFDPETDLHGSVPIGKPLGNTGVLVLGENGLHVPNKVSGELWLYGSSLANGYHGQPKVTSEAFTFPMALPLERCYQTGDLVCMSEGGHLVYLGRKDDQLKINGIRTEPSEIAQHLAQHPQVKEAVLMMSRSSIDQPTSYCTSCGIPSTYPGLTFDESGVCNLCQDYPSYQSRVSRYFKSREALEQLLKHPRSPAGAYDCLVLFSGGKDSSYALSQLVDMDLRILAYTLDNGYISDEAKANIDRITRQLGVDHMYGSTDQMNKIFVDSLKHFHNVCNGCFKAMYTLSTQVALDKQIPFVVTGLSRGQFFETRLSEELFWQTDKDVDEIDRSILEVRKAYHRKDDAIKRLLHTEFFEDDEVFEKVQFVDFYRYSDVKLEDLYRYLKEKLGWVRPTDTGRSTNCLINEVGIYYHKKTKGYHNYAFPYSWDVRVGHKVREETIDELSEEIDEDNVYRILNEIGFPVSDISSDELLVAYYQSETPVPEMELKGFLRDYLSGSQIPHRFVHVRSFPMTANGKLDREALAQTETILSAERRVVSKPANKMESLVFDIWKTVFPTVELSMDDGFADVGGTSLEAIRLVSLLKDRLRIDIPLSTFLDQKSIRSLSSYLMQVIQNKMKASS